MGEGEGTGASEMTRKEWDEIVWVAAVVYVGIVFILVMQA